MYNKFVRIWQAKKTQYWPDFSPENRDFPACSINIASCRDETSPRGYFAYLLAVKDLSTLGAFSVTVPDKEIYLNLGVLRVDFLEGKIKRNHIHIFNNNNNNNSTTEQHHTSKRIKTYGKKSELFKKKLNNNNIPYHLLVVGHKRVQKNFFAKFQNVLRNCQMKMKI